MNTVIGRRAVLASFGAGTIAVSLGACAAGTTADETPTAVDIGFLSDMSAHHAQALAMCERVLGGPTGDPVQAAATEVLRNQAYELGTMHAWLRDWGHSTAPPVTVMAWMGMNGGAGVPIDAMPGLATDAEMFELATADGEAQGRRWLELMRAHHEGGVAMATMASTNAATDKVRRLATTQAAVQTYEIAQYDELLATRYA